MTDAFIYDHVRTPRGRGKADGALHEVTALALATQALASLRARNKLDPSPRRRRRARLRRSRRRSGRRHRPRRCALRRLRQRRAGRADQPLLRLRARCGEFRRGRGDGGPARHDDRRRRRIDEPGRHRVVGRGVAGRSVDRDPGLLHAAGRFRRPHRHEVRLLARRRRRLCGGEPEARRRRLGRRPLCEIGRSGEGLQRHHAARQGRAHAAVDHHADAGAAPALVRADGPARGLRRRRRPGASRGRGGQPRASCGKLLRHRRRRRRGAHRQCRGRQARRPRRRAPASRPSPTSGRTRRSC